MHVGGCHEYRGGVQYRGGTQITKDFPPIVLNTPAVLMIFTITPHGTHDIPHGTQDIPTFIMISPTVLKISPHIHHDVSPRS